MAFSCPPISPTFCLELSSARWCSTLRGIFPVRYADPSICSARLYSAIFKSCSVGRISNFFKGFSTELITTVFKRLKSINHIPFSQHPVVVLLPCSSAENWDGEIPLKGSNAGCSLWEAYYLLFFQHTKLYAALYMAKAQLQLISLTDPDAQCICKLNLHLKWPSREEGCTINDRVEEAWFRRVCSTDEELGGEGNITFKPFESLHHDLSLLLLAIAASLAVHLPLLQPEGQRSSGQTACYVTSVLGAKWDTIALGKIVCDHIIKDCIIMHIHKGG